MWMGSASSKLRSATVIKFTLVHSSQKRSRILARAQSGFALLLLDTLEPSFKHCGLICYIQLFLRTNKDVPCSTKRTLLQYQVWAANFFHFELTMFPLFLHRCGLSGFPKSVTSLPVGMDRRVLLESRIHRRICHGRPRESSQI